VMSEGSAYWGGAYCTLSWFDREQGIVAVMMTQVRPYAHLRIREDFQQLVYQAIVDR
jgi:CubicO group peptidase (beta-lactamase class C family)